jgi:hypothetical protein
VIGDTAVLQQSAARSEVPIVLQPLATLRRPFSVSLGVGKVSRCIRRIACEVMLSRRSTTADVAIFFAPLDGSHLARTICYVVDDLHPRRVHWLFRCCARRVGRPFGDCTRRSVFRVSFRVFRRFSLSFFLRTLRPSAPRSPTSYDALDHLSLEKCRRGILCSAGRSRSSVLPRGLPAAIGRGCSRSAWESAALQISRAS